MSNQQYSLVLPLLRRRRLWRVAIHLVTVGAGLRQPVSALGDPLLVLCRRCLVAILTGRDQSPSVFVPVGFLNRDRLAVFPQSAGHRDQIGALGYGDRGVLHGGPLIGGRRRL